ncbi:MAG: hypothetical protein WCK26_03415 [Candidatus Saccharibacteria bacterium]
MEKQFITQSNRSIATQAAIGSVRAEGLNPSMKTIGYLKDYSDGRITSNQLYKLSLIEAKSILTQSLN